MRAFYRFVFRITILFVAATAFLAAPEFPSGRFFEAKQMPSLQPDRARAWTAPVSARVITAKITVDDDGDPVEASQFEGGLIRVEIFGKAIYGFSPVISDSDGGTVTIKVYRISGAGSQGQSFGEGLNEVQNLVTAKANDRSVAAYTDADASFKIEILNVQTASQAGMERPTAQDYESLMSRCCAICGGRETCACRVVTLCGGCCGNPCCPNINSPN